MNQKEWMRNEDPSDTAFEIVRATKKLLKPGTDIVKFQELDAKVEELLTYLGDFPSKRNSESLIEDLHMRGLSPVEIFGILPDLTKRIAGRPVTKRVGAIRAAEMFDEGLSWTEIAKKLYDCRDPADCFRYRERIRKAVKSVDRLFSKLRIPIPQRRSRKKAALSKQRILASS